MNILRQEEFWEDRLRQTIRDAESDPGSEAWDTPSDAVWEQVSGALEEKRRRFPVLLWWGSLAAALLLTFGGIWLAKEQQPSARGPEAKNVPLLREKELQGNDQPTAETLICPSAAENMGTPDRIRSAPRKLTTNEVKLIDSQLNKQIDRNFTLPLNAEQRATESPGQPPMPSENTIDPVVAGFATEVNPVALRGTAPVSGQQVQQTFLATPLKTQPKKIQWWAGVRGGPVYAANSVHARHPGALLFRDQETAQLSSERGLNLKMVLPSGWYAQAGVGRYGIRQTASQVFRLRFERSGERQLPSGEWESTFALSVPSSYGDTEAELDLRRDDSNPLQEGQMLVVETQTTQALQYLSYSLGGGFLKSSGRWMYGAGAGIALNALQTREFTLTARSRHSGIRLPAARTRSSFREASANTTDLQLSASVGYRVSPHWMVGAEPTLRQSLSPVVRGNGFSTVSTSVGLQLSVHYLL